MASIARNEWKVDVDKRSWGQQKTVMITPISRTRTSMKKMVVVMVMQWTTDDRFWQLLQLKFKQRNPIVHQQQQQICKQILFKCEEPPTSRYLSRKQKEMGEK